MRSLFLLLVAFPVFAGAQVNRSAKEFATEKIQEYVENKLFKNKTYKPVSYGELKPFEDKKLGIVWMIAHKFEITQGGETSFEKSVNVQHAYKFLFYMDEKMKVLKAETSYSN